MGVAKVPGGILIEKMAVDLSIEKLYTPRLSERNSIEFSIRLYFQSYNFAISNQTYPLPSSPSDLSAFRF